MTEQQYQHEIEQGHASDRTSVRGVYYAVFALVLSLVLVAAGVGLLIMLFQARQPLTTPRYTQRPIEQRPPSSPSPLDDMPAIQRDLKHTQLRRLQSLGWVDRQAGLAHVPIDVAVRHLLEQGLPTFPAQGAPDTARQPTATEPSP
jgi:hypothetical protein